MPVVAVINRKGGSGKSTLATHLAAHCANDGLRVMLGDVDRQQSSMAWLKRRAEQPLAQRAPIVGWAMDTRSTLRPPAGITHVVLDTPGGLRGFDLARVAMNADAIVMPVGASAFDRESALECHAELLTLPRVAAGRCRIALVGMRLDARTNAGTMLEAWAAQHKLPYIAALRETQGYVRSVEQGLTLFDAPAAKVQADLAQWQPIVEWLQAVWQPAPAAEARGRGALVRPVDARAANTTNMASSLPSSLASSLSSSLLPSTPLSSPPSISPLPSAAPRAPRIAFQTPAPRGGFVERLFGLFRAPSST